MRTAKILIMLSAATLVCSALSCGGQSEAARRKSVVFICMDTVRADHLGCYGYQTNPTTPFIDELASEGLLFENARATSGWTKPSVPSILTGLYPFQHGVYRGSTKSDDVRVSDVLPDDADTLAEVFSRAGYRTAAFIKNAQLRKGQGFEQGFDTFVDRAGDARNIRWQASDWIADNTSDDRPFFLYLHFLDAHWPYPVPDEYATKFTNAESIAAFRSNEWKGTRDRINDGEMELDAEKHAALLALYDGSLRYIDDQLRRFFAELERRGLAQDTVVSIVSDHGEDFLEHGRIGHGHGLYETLLHVPWILKLPNQPARRISVPVSLVDVFPTVLQAAGLTAPGALNGVDRLSYPDANSSMLAEHLFSSKYMHATYSGSDKLLRTVRRVATDPSIEWRGRYRAKLRNVSGTGWVAYDIEPRGDDDLDSELKGVVEACSATELVIMGVTLELDPTVEHYGFSLAEGSYSLPRVGSMVKVIVEANRAGELSARRIKHYAPAAEPETELRGSIEAGEHADELLIAGIPVIVERLDVVQKFASESKPRFSRENVRDFLQSLNTGLLEQYSEEHERFDWRADFLEARGLPSDAGHWNSPNRIFERPSVWTDADQTEVGSAELEALKAIGYAD